MLRHCIMQMQRQSIPVDHAIYVNSPADEQDGETTLNYQGLLNDLIRGSRNKVAMGFGPTLSTHKNYIVALNLIDIDDYDLFLKIDDDDLYFRNYAKSVANDFVERNWDYSGSESDGLLKGHRWQEHQRQSSLGLVERDLALNVPEVMPPTTAFSRRAIRAVMELKDDGNLDDILWRRHLASIPDMRLAKRGASHFVYHIHGGNLSTSHWLDN